MKKIALLATLFATPALAHEASYSHVNPHGFEALIAIALLIGVVYFFARSK